MSPTMAMQSPVFLMYAALVVGLLMTAGASLAALKWGFRINVGHAWTAFCGWLLMVPVLLLSYFLGREATIVFLTIVAILGFREFARATELRSE